MESNILNNKIIYHPLNPPVTHERYLKASSSLNDSA